MRSLQETRAAVIAAAIAVAVSLAAFLPSAEAGGFGGFGAQAVIQVQPAVQVQAIQAAAPVYFQQQAVFQQPVVVQSVRQQRVFVRQAAPVVVQQQRVFRQQQVFVQQPTVVIQNNNFRRGFGILEVIGRRVFGPRNNINVTVIR